MKRPEPGWPHGGRPPHVVVWELWRAGVTMRCELNEHRLGWEIRKLHERVLITHDLLRIECKREDERGWIYAFLRSTFARAMMSAAQYGHIIKHLEPAHLEALPLPVVTPAEKKHCGYLLERIVRLRDEAYEFLLDAEAQFARAVGSPVIERSGEEGFSVRASETLFSGRRRFDALPYNPTAVGTREHIKSVAPTESIRSLGFRVWLPTRFRRIPAEQGVELFGSSAPFEINPDAGRRIADIDFGDPHRGRVESGWLLIARSGQVYGLNGSVGLATQAHAGKVLSDHLIRVAPTDVSNVDLGYLFVAMSHPALGRPLVKSLPYGSSIPEIDVSDIEQFEVPRLDVATERTIGATAAKAAAAFGEADQLEREVAARADAVIEKLIHAETRNGRNGKH